jgi:excisionase family DNA binding protein
MGDMPTDRSARDRRFLQVADVAEVLSTTSQHVLTLLRRGDIRGIQIGGRGQWRVEDVELDAYIDRLYAARPMGPLDERTDERDPAPGE